MAIAPFINQNPKVSLVLYESHTSNHFTKWAQCSRLKKSDIQWVHPQSYFFNMLLAILGNSYTNFKIKIDRSIGIFIYSAMNLHTD